MKRFHASWRSAGPILPACLALCWCATGCAHPHSAPAAPGETSGTVRIVPAQLGAIPAAIRKVDDTYHFVVLDFSSRAMPPLGTRLAVYCGDRQVGEVRITEPSRAQFATADIVSGDLRVGDEAR